MKLFVTVFVVIGALFVPIYASADECINEWEFTLNGDPVIKIRQCVYSGGGSGYYELENLKGYEIRLCFIIKFNDGKERRGCRNMKGYEVGPGSCYSCAPKNSGVSDVDVDSYERL